MKRIFIILTIILITFTGCSADILSPNISVEQENTYILTRENCGLLFGCQTEELEIALAATEWSVGLYQSVTLNNDGSISLTLTNDQVQKWKEHFIYDINLVLEGRREGGQDFTINENYTEINYYTFYEAYKVDGYSIGVLIQDCGIMQMLNGVDLSEWSLSVSIIDMDTKTTVVKCQFPDDGYFEINDDDWADIINSTLSNSNTKKLIKNGATGVLDAEDIKLNSKKYKTSISDEFIESASSEYIDFIESIYGLVR